MPFLPPPPPALVLEHAGFHGPDGSAPALFVGSWSEWCRSGKPQAQGPG